MWLELVIIGAVALWLGWALYRTLSKRRRGCGGCGNCGGCGGCARRRR